MDGTELLATFIRWEIWLVLTGLGAAVAYQALTGRINTRGMLFDKEGKIRQHFSPARVQLLVITLSGAVYYLLRVIERPDAAQFPDMPPELLLILGGSHALYLGAKGGPLFRG